MSQVCSQDFAPGFQTQLQPRDGVDFVNTMLHSLYTLSADNLCVYEYIHVHKLTFKTISAALSSKFIKTTSDLSDSLKLS